MAETPADETGMTVGTISKTAITKKSVMASQVSETGMRHSVRVSREIKRSAICAAITLAAMAALYFTFR